VGIAGYAGVDTVFAGHGAAFALTDNPHLPVHAILPYHQWPAAVADTGIMPTLRQTSTQHVGQDFAVIGSGLVTDFVGYDRNGYLLELIGIITRCATWCVGAACAPAHYGCCRARWWIIGIHRHGCAFQWRCQHQQGQVIGAIAWVVLRVYNNALNLHESATW